MFPVTLSQWFSSEITREKISRALLYLVCQVTASSMYLPSKSHRGAKYLGYGNSSLPMLKCHEVNSVLWWKLCWGEKVWLKWKKRQLNIIRCTLQGFDYWKVVKDIVCIGMNSESVVGNCASCAISGTGGSFFLFSHLNASLLSSLSLSLLLSLSRKILKLFTFTHNVNALFVVPVTHVTVWLTMYVKIFKLFFRIYLN